MRKLILLSLLFISTLLIGQSAIFSTTFSVGSFRDAASNILPLITHDIEFGKGEKGLYIYSDNSAQTYYSGYEDLPSTFTSVCYFKLKKGFTSREELFGFTNTTSPVFTITVEYDAGTYKLYGKAALKGSGTLSHGTSKYVNVDINKWYCAIITYDNGSYNFYVDNIETTNTFSAANIFNVGNGTFFVGTWSYISFGMRYSNIAYCATYPYVFSAQQRNNSYIDFLNPPSLNQEYTIISQPQNKDLSYLRNTNFTGDEYTQVIEFTDNTSSTSTLRLNDGGDFAVVDWTGDSDFQEISISAETTSSVIPSSIKIFAKNGLLTYFRSSNNNFSFDIADLPSGLTYYLNYGSNTTSGDIASLPSGLTDYRNKGSNQTFGDISGLPSGLTVYYNEGSNTTSGDIASLPSGLTIYRNDGSNQTSGDIADLPSGLTYYLNYGSNQTSGDIADLPSGLTYYYNDGSNQTSGDIADLPSGLTVYLNYGSNQTFGDIASLPSGLTDYYNTGSNTTSGDIASLPSGLTDYYNTGLNTTSGDIASLPSGLTYYYNTGLNQVDTYTSGHTFSASINYFYHRPAAGYGLSDTEVDNLLIDLESSGMSSGTIDLAGNNTARTSASDAAVTSLESKGVTVNP